MQSHKLIIKGALSEMSDEEREKYEDTLKQLHEAIDKDSAGSLLALSMFSIEVAEMIE